MVSAPAGTGDILRHDIRISLILPPTTGIGRMAFNQQAPSASDDAEGACCPGTDGTKRRKEWKNPADVEKTHSYCERKYLQKKLLRYAAERRISTGSVYVTKSGIPMSLTNIWREMKNLCVEAKVNPEKVFPHNLRHLFARVFYSIEKDIAKLADILGHSSISTTRIYIMTTGAEHRQRMEQMRLIL